jgi:hypothetical protein
MSNIAGKAYALNVITPLARWHYWVKLGIVTILRAFPTLLAGLQGLSIIHFARWVVIRRKDWPDLGQGKETRLRYDYMIFFSNFNGTWDQYIDAFSDGIPDNLDLAWYGDYRYPQSIPLSPFKRYIQHNQFDTEYYYNATPGAAQRDIKASIRVMVAVRKLQSLHGTSTPEEFAQAYRKTMVEVQNDLGTQGMSPVASSAAHRAAIARQDGINRIWASAAPVSD